MFRIPAILQGCRKWRVIVILLILLTFSYCSLSVNRSGLFNNRHDLVTSLQEHNTAWQERTRGSLINRLDLLIIIRKYEGTCLTSEVNWVAVNLDQRLDMSPRGRSTPIECRVQVPARWPMSLFKAFVWTLVFNIQSEDVLKLIEVRRNSLI